VSFFKRLCRLGDVLSSLTSKKDIIPYENSMLTKLLADSLGIDIFFLLFMSLFQHLFELSDDHILVTEIACLLRGKLGDS